MIIKFNIANIKRSRENNNEVVNMNTKLLITVFSLCCTSAVCASHSIPDGVVSMDIDVTPNVTDLIVRDIDGTNYRNLTSTAMADEKGGKFSPDGSRIVFYSNRHSLWDRLSDIYVMDTWDLDNDGHGDNCVRITNDVSFVNREAADPDWSPVGDKIVFSSNKVDQNKYDLYTINADGTGRQKITTSPTEDLSPSWSPDGANIVFVRDRGLHLFNGATLMTSVLTSGKVDRSPSWKDNSTVGFSRYNVVSKKFDLFEIDISTAAINQISTTAMSNEDSPVYSFDGVHLIHTKTLGDGVDPTEIILSHSDFTNQLSLTSNTTRDIASDWGVVSPPSSLPSPIGLGSCKF